MLWNVYSLFLLGHNLVEPRWHCLWIFIFRVVSDWCVYHSGTFFFFFFKKLIWKYPLTWGLEVGDRVSEYYQDIYIFLPIPFIISKLNLGVPEDLQKFCFSHAEVLLESDINFMTAGICSESVCYIWTIEMFLHRTDSSHGLEFHF